MLPKIRVEFCITGTKILPDEITNLLEVSPTKTWFLNDSIQGTALKRKHHGWCISTNYEKDLDLEKLVRSILEVLSPKSKIIEHLCSEYELECEISCGVYVVDETPTINFDQDIISKLAKLNASLDIDVILTE